MANLKGSGGRRPKSTESRIAVLARVPERAFEGIQEIVDELGVSRSDFAAYAAIKVANELRQAEGLELIDMPDYIVATMRHARDHQSPLQGALLAS